MPGEDGFSYSPHALERVGAALRHGAKRLDEATGAELIAPDAGASSSVVGTAISDLLKAAVTGAQLFDDTAGKVHASNGGYSEVENNTAGQFQLTDERGGWNASRR